MARTPGVGVVRRYEVDVALGVEAAVAAMDEAALAEADNAEAASVALVRLKPSG